MIRAAAAGLLAAALAAGAVQASPFAVVLKTLPPLLKDSESMPRIVSPATPATARINADLAKVDADWVAEAKDCRGDGKNPYVYVERHYFVQMRGPGYFALLLSDEENCGGPHPDNVLTPITYDLTNGQRVNWLAMFPPSAKLRAAYDTLAGEGPPNLFRSPVLQAIYLKRARAQRSAADWKQCTDALDNPEGLDFQLVPDAAKGSLVLSLQLPRVVMACGDDIDLVPTDMRRLGVEPRLVAAIEQSHAAWLAWKAAHPDQKASASQ